MSRKFPDWFKGEIYRINMKLINEGWSWEDIISGYEDNIEHYKSSSK